MKVNLDIEGGENKYLETELRGFLGWEYNFGVFLYERPWEALGLSLVPALLQATVYKFVSQNVQNWKKKKFWKKSGKDQNCQILLLNSGKNTGEWKHSVTPIIVRSSTRNKKLHFQTSFCTSRNT